VKSGFRTAGFVCAIFALATAFALPNAHAEPQMPHDAPYNSDGSPRTLPASPPSLPGRALVLVYGDFGPQALSYELLGFERYAWTKCACFSPFDRFDVRVVVYTGSEKEIRKRYPTVPGVSDHRLVSYKEAHRFLDAAIADITSDNEAMEQSGDLLRLLRHTRARLEREFK